MMLHQVPDLRYAYCPNFALLSIVLMESSMVSDKHTFKFMDDSDHFFHPPMLFLSFHVEGDFVEVSFPSGEGLITLLTGHYPQRFQVNQYCPFPPCYALFPTPMNLISLLPLMNCFPPSEMSTSIPSSPPPLMGSLTSLPPYDMPDVSPPSYDSHDFLPPLELATDPNGPSSLESATDSLALPSPFESAYDTDSEREATHMVQALPNFGSRPCYNYGSSHPILDIRRGNQRTSVSFAAEVSHT